MTEPESAEQEMIEAIDQWRRDPMTDKTDTDPAVEKCKHCGYVIYQDNTGVWRHSDCVSFCRTRAVHSSQECFCGSSHVASQESVTDPAVVAVEEMKKLPVMPDTTAERIAIIRTAYAERDKALAEMRQREIDIAATRIMSRDQRIAGLRHEIGGHLAWIAELEAREQRLVGLVEKAYYEGQRDFDLYPDLGFEESITKAALATLMEGEA
jgi:hypothetical protein